MQPGQDSMGDREVPGLILTPKVPQSTQSCTGRGAAVPGERHGEALRCSDVSPSSRPLLLRICIRKVSDVPPLKSESPKWTSRFYSHHSLNEFIGCPLDCHLGRALGTSGKAT